MQRAQDRVEGTAWEGPFSVGVSAKLVGTQWGCRVQGQRQVRQGGPVVALAKDLKSFPLWGPTPAAWWHREKENLQGGGGVSGTSFPLITVETSHEMLWQRMVNWHSLTFHDLHPMRNKNLHNLTSSTWVADEQTVLSWQDTRKVTWKMNLSMNQRQSSLD